MKNKTEDTSPLWTKIADSPVIKGPVLGASVLTIVTPLLKWTNHRLHNEKMPLRHPMSGAMAYATSAVPDYAVVFAIKALLKKSPEETSKMYDLLTSFTAGASSGLMNTPFDSVAQNKQLTKNPSTKATAQKMYSHHGFNAFFQGGAGTALREGSWSTVYMSAIPLLSTSLQKRGHSKRVADFLAVLSVAGTYGLFSSPLNQLRYRKQLGLTNASQKKSYLEHAIDIYNQDPNANNVARLKFFFKAGVPRMVTTTAAAGLLVKGTEFFNQTLDYFRK